MKDIENRADVKQMVDSFYIVVRADKRLGFLFDDTAKVNWETHLPVMYDFWESMLFDKALFKGNPMEKHITLNGVEQLFKEDFDTWLSLFITNIDKQFTGAVTEKAKQRAESVAMIIKTKTVYSGY